MMNRNVLHLTCPPIPVLRIGFVGLGNRGILALERYMHLEGVWSQVRILSSRLVIIKELS